MSDWQTEAYLRPQGDSQDCVLAQEIYDKGLLFLANQNALHHYGYALGVTLEEESGKVIGINLHKTDDPDGIWFDEELLIEGRRKLHGKANT